MSRRYYSAEPVVGAAALLADAEAHHLLHVLRAAPGMRVVLFDGTGAEFEAEVTACRRASVELAVLERRDVNRELRPPLVLGAPLPKGDRTRWLVEKAVELGVTRLVPLVTEHSESSAGSRGQEKLDRYVIEASKQCGRNRLMEIGASVAWEDWLRLPDKETGADYKLASRRWIADPSGRPIAAADLADELPTFAAVGPEGGLTEGELAAAVAAGWEVVGLGSRILRVETAVAALAALAGLGR